MKKKIFLIATIVALFAIVTSGTFAYFTGEETAHNIITSGGAGVGLLRKTELPDGTLESAPETDITGVMPGMVISKIISVENQGDIDAWVRLRVESYITAKNGEKLPNYLDDGSPVMYYEISSSWIEKDGYYYYDGLLKPGMTSDNFIEEVHFNMNMGNEYQECTAKLLIYTEALQAANNGTSALTASGWPTDNNN